MSSLPSWLPQRLDDPHLPELPDGGTVTLALVASNDARAEGWSARSAVAMGRGWALSGLPTCLCDLGLEEPTLHHALQRSNGEGVTDLILYGASPRHVAQRVEQDLFLVTAGTPAPEPGAVRASPRWDALVDAFQEGGGLLLLYVPADVPGLDAVLARADGVVVLRTDGESVELGEAEARLLGSFGPAAADEDRGGAPSPGTAPEEAVRPEEGPVRGPAGTSPGPSQRRGCFRWILMVILLVALVLVLAAALGWIRIPGLGPGAASATLIPSPPVAQEEGPSHFTAAVRWSTSSASAGQEAPVQAWALALEAHRDGDTAAARVQELSSRWPELLFWVAPVRVRDVRFHRVLAGPATTEGEVEDLRKRLGGDASWIPREAGLAFRLGEMADLEAARTWAGVLAEMGIPTHILRAPGVDGSDTYHIYAGGYASEAEASELAGILREKDLEFAPLAERRGRLPA